MRSRPSCQHPQGASAHFLCTKDAHCSANTITRPGFSSKLRQAESRLIHLIEHDFHHIKVTVVFTEEKYLHNNIRQISLFVYNLNEHSVFGVSNINAISVILKA